MENYTDSGVVEAYCLGLLPAGEAAAITLAAANDPVLQQHILDMETALKNYAASGHAQQLKQSILDTLPSIPAPGRIDITHPPLIDRNSDIGDWNEAIADIKPEADHGNIKTTFIAFSDELQLCIAWLTGTLVEDEHHEEDFEESFLILEGSCTCDIGGMLFNLQAGDFLDIPFNTPHTITSTSANGYVKAIIQRKKTAA